MAGRRSLSKSRALTCDVLHFHRQVPTCAHDRWCDLSRIAAVRAGMGQRVSWAMAFIKAYALIAKATPVLRQSYIRWPWPHVYEHEHSVAMVAIHREFRGEPWLFWGRLENPAEASLLELQARLERYLSQPVSRVFKKQLQFAALPMLARRVVWNWNLHVAARKRARRTGTFFLTTLAGQGVEIQHPPAFLTGNLTYGPIGADGRSRVTLAYDHRLTDGRQIATCLQELETTLNGTIADEMASLSRSAPLPDAA